MMLQIMNAARFSSCISTTGQIDWSKNPEKQDHNCFPMSEDRKILMLQVPIISSESDKILNKENFVRTLSSPQPS